MIPTTPAHTLSDVIDYSTDVMHTAKSAISEGDMMSRQCADDFFLERTLLAFSVVILVTNDCIAFTHIFCNIVI
jgi:hypothetical protein